MFNRKKVIVMKKSIYIFLATLLIFCSCQETEFGPEKSPENGVINIAFIGQTVACVINTVPALETQERNTIEVTLAPGTDYSAVRIVTLEISGGATTELNVGDELDMNAEYSFTVTAENGWVRTYTILPPKKFSVKEQGPLLTSTNAGGSAITLTLGEWLCMGQNRLVDVNAAGDTIGFFRCHAHGYAPFVSVNKSASNSLSEFEGDRDDYLIFRSNGTYEFSYGKDGLSSSLTGNDTYKDYLMKQCKGYWQIGEGLNFLVANREPKNQGLYLTDAETGNVHFFGYVNVADGVINIQGWPLSNSSLRIAYKFATSAADADWQQWLVNPAIY
jgi:hypothetical protein